MDINQEFKTRMLDMFIANIKHEYIGDNSVICILASDS